MHAAFRDAKLRALADGIRGIFKHGEQLFIFGPRFFPFVPVVKSLGALLLHFHAGISIFFPERVHYLRQGGAGWLGLVGQRVFVEDRLIVLRRARKLMGSLISVSAFEKQRGLCRRPGISLQRVDGFLRVPELNRGRRESFQDLLAHGGCWVVVQNRLQNLVSVRVASQRALRLRRPVQRVFAKQRVVLRLHKQAHSLPRAVLHILVITKSERGARAPNVRGVLCGERRKFFVCAGRGVVQRAGKLGKFFLRGFVFRRIGRNLRLGRFRLASRAARR